MGWRDCAGGTVGAPACESGSGPTSHARGLHLVASISGMMAETAHIYTLKWESAVVTAAFGALDSEGLVPPRYSVITVQYFVPTSCLCGGAEETYKVNLAAGNSIGSQS